MNNILEGFVFILNRVFISCHHGKLDHEPQNDHFIAFTSTDKRMSTYYSSFE